MSFGRVDHGAAPAPGARTADDDGSHDMAWDPFGSWPMDEQECWARLAAARFGRVVLDAPAGPTALPVAHVVVGRSVVFRTSPYGLIGRNVGGERVGFQVDDVRDPVAGAWSVHLHARAELHGGAEDLDLVRVPAPWPDGSRWLFVRLTPEGPEPVTGIRLAPVAGR